MTGIGETTYYRWMEMGENARSGKYREFWEAVTRAEAVAETSALADWRRHFDRDWRAAKEFLERRFSVRWRLPRDGEAGTGGGDVYVIREEQLDEIRWDLEVDKMLEAKK
jgi:hypothetical protein